MILIASQPKITLDMVHTLNNFFYYYMDFTITLYIKVTVCTYLSMYLCPLFTPELPDQSPPNFAQTSPPTQERFLTQAWPRQPNPCTPSHPNPWTPGYPTPGPPGTQPLDPRVPQTLKPKWVTREKTLSNVKCPYGWCKLIKFFPGSAGARLASKHIKIQIIKHHKITIVKMIPLIGVIGINICM